MSKRDRMLKEIGSYERPEIAEAKHLPEEVDPLAKQMMNGTPDSFLERTNLILTVPAKRRNVPFSARIRSALKSKSLYEQHEGSGRTAFRAYIKIFGQSPKSDSGRDGFLRDRGRRSLR